MKLLLKFKRHSLFLSIFGLAAALYLTLLLTSQSHVD